MKKTILLAIALAGLFVFNGFPMQSKFEGKIVRKIEYTGLKNVDAEDLHDVMITQEGLPLKADEIRSDIKAIFKEGKLKNVSVEVEEFNDGVRIKFFCEERPIVEEIVIKGNDEVIENELLDLIKIKQGDVLRTDIIEKSLAAIKKKYNDEGLFNAVIRYKVEPYKKDKHAVVLTFVIDEGEEIKIEKISILGTKKIANEDAKSVIELKEDGVFANGSFKRDIYEQDKAKIIAYYKERGYLDAQIIEDKVEYEWKNPEKKEKRAIFITIKISEGERYYFNTYTVEGNKVIERKVFEEQFEQTDHGEIFNDTKFQKDRQMISFTYSTQGYVFARINPRRSVEEKEVKVDGKIEKRKFVRIDFQITEGNKANIENIIIKGNKKTKENVIRRELLVKEGEIFNTLNVQRSRERIFNLGFFKEVNIDMRPGSKEDFMNLIIDVEEQPTGTISLGGGYGTTSGFSIFADVGENNLLGYGHRIGCRFEYGPLRSSVTLSYRWPWLFDYPIFFSTSIFYSLMTLPANSLYTNDGSANYQKQSIGYSLGLGYQFFYYYSIGTRWTHSFLSLLDPSGNSADEVFLEAARGVQEKRTVSFYVQRDSRDNVFNPTGGSMTRFEVGFTGGYLLGGDSHYIKYSPELYIYYSPFNIPMLKTHRCVIELRGNADFMMPPLQKSRVENMQNQTDNPWLKVEDRLIIGGPETLRGWDYYDTTFPESWQIGMFHKILYGAEFRIPIHPQMLWFTFFFDAGSLWSDSFWLKSLENQLDSSTYAKILEDLNTGQLRDIRDFGKGNLMSYFRYSWGFGFKIQIPMMPLRFWFGKKMLWTGHDHGYFKEISGFTFQFGIGDMRF